MNKYEDYLRIFHRSFTFSIKSLIVIGESFMICCKEKERTNEVSGFGAASSEHLTDKNQNEMEIFRVKAQFEFVIEIIRHVKKRN